MHMHMQEVRAVNTPAAPAASIVVDCKPGERATPQLLRKTNTQTSTASGERRLHKK